MIRIARRKESLEGHLVAPDNLLRSDLQREFVFSGARDVRFTSSQPLFYIYFKRYL